MSKKKLSLSDGWEIYAEDEDNQNFIAHKRRGDNHLVQVQSSSADGLVENVKQWEAAQDKDGES